MRAAIGEMELDEILHARAQLNTIIRGAVQEGATPWGLSVLRWVLATPCCGEREQRALALDATRLVCSVGTLAELLCPVHGLAHDPVPRPLPVAPSPAALAQVRDHGGDARPQDP